MRRGFERFANGDGSDRGDDAGGARRGFRAQVDRESRSFPRGGPGSALAAAPGSLRVAHDAEKSFARAAPSVRRRHSWRPFRSARGFWRSLVLWRRHRFHVHRDVQGGGRSGSRSRSGPRRWRPAPDCFQVHAAGDLEQGKSDADRSRWARILRTESRIFGMGMLSSRIMSAPARAAASASTGVVTSISTLPPVGTAHRAFPIASVKICFQVLVVGLRCLPGRGGCP